MMVNRILLSTIDLSQRLDQSPTKPRTSDMLALYGLQLELALDGLLTSFTRRSVLGFNCRT